MDFEIPFLVALTIDLILGDPRWFPHPVRAIGWLCLNLEAFFRSAIKNEKFAGIATFFAVLIITTGGILFLLLLLGHFSHTIQTGVSVLLIYSFIAAKDLLVHSKKVYSCLYPDVNLEKARRAVGQIVGRDTTELNQQGICKACIETVAENMVDGITAPIFWATVATVFTFFTPLSPIVLAAIGITFYKTVNTMDSMFGYKNTKYIHFGWLAARFDDFVNFVPARLSGVCVVFGAFLSGKNWKNGLKIFLRDRLEHTSPNAGHTEAAVAGVLSIQLGGSSMYFGKEILKPTMGENKAPASSKHILTTHQIILLGSAIFLIIVLLLRRYFIFLIAA